MFLLLDVRQKSHEPSAFYGCFYRSLLLCGKAGSLATHYAAMRIYELLEQIYVLIVDVLDIILRQNIRHTMIVLERNVVRINIVFRVINARASSWSSVLHLICVAARTATSRT